MNISISQAAKDWRVSRTTIYHKISNGELSRGADKKIDTSEMIRVFGEPKIDQQVSVQSERLLNNVQKTHMNNKTEQRMCSDVENKLEIELLKNKYLSEQVANQKLLIENYQQQISQLNKSLSQATASINEFAQARLLEFKRNNEVPEKEKKSGLAQKNRLEENRINNIDARSVFEKMVPKKTKNSKLRSIVKILVGID